MSIKNIIVPNKAVATIVVGLICALLMHYTHGEHGIGWFIFALALIWIDWN